MAVLTPRGEAFNRTRQTHLATSLAVADTHWTRLRGLLGLSANDFSNGCGLWITPCRGVHTLGMGFPIDVVYLDRTQTVVHIERNLRPWRLAPVTLEAASVLELPCRSIVESETAVGDKIDITMSPDTCGVR
ncbi:MAG: DUF192 domain-containing protein [Candidatus Sulfotelmatobacter sp.]